MTFRQDIFCLKYNFPPFAQFFIHAISGHESTEELERYYHKKFRGGL
jgi:hypothetical protein